MNIVYTILGYLFYGSLLIGLIYWIIAIIRGTFKKPSGWWTWRL